ncbi:oxidoreductase domain-containing protein [Lederbergia lenta]|uniref:Oxidoreductase domain-containing protein n=1 Tax=Lederbergia lenta TaxID=1467 RepID=A0A2X4WQY0_LEDLE|nr:oxidoreductase domain-containing protein [Lederbergia lenta]
MRVAIIGCGGNANQKHLPSLAKVDDVEIVGFCDVLIERGKKAAKEQLRRFGEEGSRLGESSGTKKNMVAAR